MVREKRKSPQALCALVWQISAFAATNALQSARARILMAPTPIVQISGLRMAVAFHQAQYIEHGFEQGVALGPLQLLTAAKESSARVGCCIVRSPIAVQRISHEAVIVARVNK